MEEGEVFLKKSKLMLLVLDQHSCDKLMLISAGF